MALWKDVLQDKYGENITDLVDESISLWPYWMSRWWKHLVSLEGGLELEWFNAKVERKARNGTSTSF